MTKKKKKPKKYYSHEAGHWVDETYTSGGCIGNKKLVDTGFGVKPTNDKEPLFFRDKIIKFPNKYWKFELELSKDAKFIDPNIYDDNTYQFTGNVEIPLSIIIPKILPELEKEFRKWESHLSITNGWRKMDFWNYLHKKYDKPYPSPPQKTQQRQKRNK